VITVSFNKNIQGGNMMKNQDLIPAIKKHLANQDILIDEQGRIVINNEYIRSLLKNISMQQDSEQCVLDQTQPDLRGWNLLCNLFVC